MGASFMGPRQVLDVGEQDVRQPFGSCERFGGVPRRGGRAPASVACAANPRVTGMRRVRFSGVVAP